MIKAKLKLSLLSDAVPGNGEGLAGIIDTDICYDEYGLPYVPAKRIKGILRESAQDLVDYQMATAEQVNDMFGQSGTKMGTDLKIDNGFLEGYQDLRKFLAEASLRHDYKQLFSTQAVLQCFTYTRSRTALENGIAQDKSLRTLRILKRGIVFIFDVEMPDDMNMYTLLKDSCKVTRRFGLSRTRGVGEIKMELAKAQATSNTQTQQISGSLKLILRNLGPILATSRVGTPQASDPYIPGATILGAVAAKFIRDQKTSNTSYSPDQDHKFTDLFINGSVSWGNAYPTREGKVRQPVPLAWKREKHGDRTFNLASEDDLQTVRDTDVALKGFGNAYIASQGNGYSTVEANTQIEYHHRRPLDRKLGSPTKDDGEFFQFETLAAGQEFVAEITGDNASLEIVLPYLQNGIIHLGKSRTAQYGACEVEVQSAAVGTPQLIIQSGDEFQLILLSDAIIRNAGGRSLASVAALQSSFIELVESKLSLSATLELLTDKSFFGTTRSGGYMGVWNLPLPQEACFQAGSVFTFVNRGDADINLSGLDQCALGAYCERGFGRFILTQEIVSEPMLTPWQPEAGNTAPTITIPPVLYPALKRQVNIKIEQEAVRKADGQKRKPHSSSEIRRVMAAVTAATGPDRCDQIMKNLDAIKKYQKNGFPGWLKPIKACLPEKDNNYPVWLTEILQNLIPGSDLVEISGFLDIEQTSRDTCFPYLEKYILTYLRTLAVQLRQSRLTQEQQPAPEDQPEQEADHE